MAAEIEPIVSAMCSHDRNVRSFAKNVFGSARCCTTPGILGLVAMGGLLNHQSRIPGLRFGRRRTGTVPEL